MPSRQDKPLHHRVAETIRAELRGRPVGERVETEQRMAKRLGVSVLTVREALSALVREGLIVRRRGSGTYIAEPVSRRTIAVLMEFDIADPRASWFHRRLVQTVRRQLRTRGYRTRLYLGDRPIGQPVTAQAQAAASPESGGLSCPELIEDAHEEKFAAVIAVSSLPGAWLTTLADLGIPTVGDMRAYRASMGLDHGSLVRIAVDQLATAARKRIAIMGWGRSAVDAFIERMAEHKLPVEPKWIRSDLPPSQIGAGREEFLSIWKAQRKKPDGLIVCDDYLFRDAVPAIISQGVQVPDKLLIVTHENMGDPVDPGFPVFRLSFDPDRVAQGLVDRAIGLIKDQEVQPTHARITAHAVTGQPADSQLEDAGSSA